MYRHNQYWLIDRHLREGFFLTNRVFIRDENRYEICVYDLVLKVDHITYTRINTEQWYLYWCRSRKKEGKNSWKKDTNVKTVRLLLGWVKESWWIAINQTKYKSHFDVKNELNLWEVINFKSLTGHVTVIIDIVQFVMASPFTRPHFPWLFFLRMREGDRLSSKIARNI
jgi:hypothetical protein